MAISNIINRAFNRAMSNNPSGGQMIYGSLQPGVINQPVNQPMTYAQPKQPVQQKTVTRTQPRSSVQSQSQSMNANNQISEIIEEYKQALNEANQANEDRYNEIKGRKTARDKEIRDLYRKRYMDAMNLLDNAGENEKAEIALYWKGQSSEGMQNLVDRGLIGTTITGGEKRAYGKAMQADTARLNEAIRQQRLDVGSRLSGEEALAIERSGQDLDSFIERREDTGPDANLLLQLAQGIGQASVPAQQIPAVQQNQYAQQQQTQPVQQYGQQQPAQPVKTKVKKTVTRTPVLKTSRRPVYSMGYGSGTNSVTTYNNPRSLTSFYGSRR